MPTAKMSSFIEFNVNHPIIEGEWLTSDKRRIATKADMDDATYLRFKFLNGSVRTMHRDDLDSAPEFKPRWAEVF